MMAVPTATLDRDDLAQIRAIAVWQGRFSGYAVIDAVRKDIGRTERPRVVQFGGFDRPCPGDQMEQVLDRLTVEQALRRLSKVQRDLVESTVLGDVTVADWARERGWDDERARRLRIAALARLSLSPEIRSLVGRD